MSDLTLTLTGDYEGLQLTVPGEMKNDDGRQVEAGILRQLINRVLQSEARLELLAAQCQDAGDQLKALGQANWIC